MFIQAKVRINETSKSQRKFLAANLESICQKVDKDIDQGMKEEFHEFLRG